MNFQIWKCMFGYKYACLHVCMYVCMYVCMLKSMFVFPNIFGRFIQIFLASHVTRLQSCVQLSMNSVYIFSGLYLCGRTSARSLTMIPIRNSPRLVSVCANTLVWTEHKQAMVSWSWCWSRTRPTRATKCQLDSLDSGRVAVWGGRSYRWHLQAFIDEFRIKCSHVTDWLWALLFRRLGIRKEPSLAQFSSPPSNLAIACIRCESYKIWWRRLRGLRIWYVWDVRTLATKWNRGTKFTGNLDEKMAWQHN